MNVAEHFADGRATREQLLAAYDLAYSAVDDCLHESPFSEDQAIAAFGSSSEDAEEAARDAVSYGWSGDIRDAERAKTTLLREIFGNPFRALPALSPCMDAWNDGVVVKLAEAAYEKRSLPSGELDPVRLAVLADALEEVGADAPLLEHLRGPGPHVRGCWVIDSLTGRK